jgi:hypothetical protein
VYEEAADADDDVDMSFQLPKTLAALGMGAGASVYIEDFIQNLRVQMMVVHSCVPAVVGVWLGD